MVRIGFGDWAEREFEPGTWVTPAGDHSGRRGSSPRMPWTQPDLGNQRARATSNNDALECRIAVKAKCAPSGRLACGFPSVQPWPGSPYQEYCFTPKMLCEKCTHGREWKGLDLTKSVDGLGVCATG